MSEKTIEIIIKTIAEASSNFGKLQDEVDTRMQELGIECRYGLERPIAAYTNSYLSEKIQNSKIMHELPLSGKNIKNKSEIIEKNKNDIGISDVKIPKKYKYFEIDGYLSVNREGEYDDYFIEYKVSNNFNYLYLAMDFIKYLIYMSNSEKETTFIYVNYTKDTNGKIKIFNEKPDFHVIDDNELINIVSVASLKKDILIATSKRSVDQKSSLEKFLQLEKFTKKIDNNIEFVLNDDDLENDKKFLNNLALKRKIIYGKNVLFSLKMRNNFTIIEKCFEKIKESGKYDMKNSGDDNYRWIRNTLAALKQEKVGNNSRADAANKLLRQSTNWLLAFLEASMKLYWPEIRDLILSDLHNNDDDDDERINLFNIKEIYKYGKTGKLLDNFGEMIEKIIEKLNNEKIHREKAMFIFRHIVESYNLVIDMKKENSEYNVLDFNDDYYGHVKRLKILDNLNGLRKDILKSDRKPFKMSDFSKKIFPGKMQVFSEKIILSIIN